MADDTTNAIVRLFCHWIGYVIGTAILYSPCVKITSRVWVIFVVVLGSELTLTPIYYPQ